MRSDTTSQEFFDSKYQQQEDPWDFASSHYEQHRYAAIYRALAHRHYHLAIEPGCSIGVLTARLAPLCDHLHAFEISPTAVRQAQERCKALPNVKIDCGALPDFVPPGECDLIVFCEIGYYFEQDALRRLGATLVNQLSEQGVLLAAHWLGTSEDHVLRGDCVHTILGSLDGLLLDYSERYTGFRLDRWVRG